MKIRRFLLTVSAVIRIARLGPRAVRGLPLFLSRAKYNGGAAWQGISPATAAKILILLILAFSICFVAKICTINL